MNWAGNVAYSALDVRSPASANELLHVLTSSSSVRVLGSRHSFNGIADNTTLVSLARMPERFEVAVDRTSVTVDGAMTYGRLAELLAPEGLAVHNLASLPHISIAGAIATGTHGSGRVLGNLATAVIGLEIMTPDGEVTSLTQGDADFDGAVVALGALGVVSAVTLSTEPSFDVAQHVIEGLPWSALTESFDVVMGSTYSVSAFTRFRDEVDQLWLKDRVDQNRWAAVESHAFGGQLATQDRHPILELDPTPCTPQLGQPGLWSDRLPHFRMGFTPSAGEEIQSEFFVDRTDAGAAILALRDASSEFLDALMVSEIRTIAGDRFWMSPHYSRDSAAFHFTWHPDSEAAAKAASAIERALEPFGARPHWGKVFSESNFDPGAHYDRVGDFAGLVHRFDPEGSFTNPWFERVFAAR